MNSDENNKGAWIVAVDMGYGHQRTAYPLRKYALGGKVINANNYEGIPEKDQRIWESTREFYEFISDFKRVPLVGNFAFSIFDKFQQIPTYYPERDLSKPTFSLSKIFSAIKKGWGKDLIEQLGKNPAPLVATFFTPAFMAEFFGYPGEIYCVICDADVSRAWADMDPKKSRIKYFAPNSWVVERLKLYGVREENIFLTGYPLPTENIGTEKMEVAKEDLARRLVNLDPRGKYREHYKPLIDKYLGALPNAVGHPLTIMFSVGGAGAQKEIALKAVKSLKDKIQKKEIRMFLSAGVKKEVEGYFNKEIKKIGLGNNENLEIVFSPDINSYFDKFSLKLKETDILWTKPSELSFYVGLGLPIIIAPSIGSQEDFNRRWLLRMGAGILQENPSFSHQWIIDYLESGRFAEAAMQGFIEVEKRGAYNIKRICQGLSNEKAS